YATPFPSASCTTTCNLPGGAKKQGQKFNDLLGDGIKDPGDPGIPNWTINVYDTLGNLVTSMPTDASGNYSFDLNPGSSTVCEVLKSGWTQTFPPAANPPGIVSCAPFGAGLGPLGYAITLAQGQTDTGNDFGNHFNTKQCPEDPTAKVTLFVDGVQFTT